MKIYHLKALNAKGHYIEKTLTATDDEDVKTLCEKKDWVLLAFESRVIGVEKVSKSAKVINQLELIYTFKQLSQWLKAGLPLLKAIESAYKTLPTASALRVIFQSIYNSLVTGTSFATALLPYQKDFGLMVYFTLSTGEKANALQTSFDCISDWMKERYDFKSRIKSALHYPIFVAILAFFLLIGVLMGIVPQFQALFDVLLGPQIQLPLLTEYVLKANELLLSHFWLISGFFVTLLIASIYGFKKWQPGSRLMYRVYRLPYIKTFFKHQFYLQLFYSFALLLKNNTPIPMTIALLGDIFQQTPLGRPLNNSLNHLRAGHTLTESLSMENLIPKEWIGLMKASEYSHQLPDTFQHLSQIEQSLLQRKWNTVLKFIEPVCIFLLSIMIGGVIILLLYPILTLLDLENAL